MGDRFAHQAKAQLLACTKALEAGVQVTPVWNKSNREHMIIGSEPSQTRAAADAAVKALAWTGPYFVDADHINLKTADRFLAPCDFFTIDVADDIGRPADPAAVDAFICRHPELVGQLSIPLISQPFTIGEYFVRRVAATYLAAVQQAGRIYRELANRRGEGTFVTEISIDETDWPQTPPELLVILAAIADEKIPIQTIAPKFTGRFNKGVDYVGDVQQFVKEFREDLATISFAIARYGLPFNLKLSVHSGSDKYSIYPAIRDAIREFDTGVHLKTAGTTWLEELIGLASSAGEGLALTKEIYAEAHAHAAELCAPYAAVIDIDTANLPMPTAVANWTSEQFVRALRHDGRRDPAFSPNLRQLLHVAFKVAAKMGDRYTKALETNEEIIATNVITNLFERHIRPIFLD
jgi:hypothetical protein